MRGLNCLLQNGNQIQLIAAAMRDMADTMLRANPDAEITVPGLYRKLKGAGVDIDMESVAYIYADEFANDINQYNNYHTEDELEEFSKKYPPVSSAVKKALIDAGYSKKTKSGDVILDWTKLMRKSEEEIRKEIKDAGLGNEDEILGALQNEWKQIVSTALIKAKNYLGARNKDATPTERNAIDKIADLHVRGLFADFKDTYRNAIHKAIGTSRETLGDLAELDKLGHTARLLQLSPYGTSNVLAQQLQHDINRVISKARFRDSNYFYKALKFVANLFDMANLAMLNNISNRTQNFLSGYAERASSKINYKALSPEIIGLAKQTAKDVILNGGVDAGDVNNIFYGDRSASEKVREFLTQLIKDPGTERAANWTYGFFMGTSALNGIDNSMKVKNTWSRFIQGMEDILVSKELAKGGVVSVKDVRAKLNEELFGQKWEKAREVAEKTMREINSKGGTINITPQSIERFTADIVKGQLVQNGILTQEELTAAWDAGYKSAGRAMGHVPNNWWTKVLNKAKESSTNAIEKQLTKGNYTKAAFLTLTDIFMSKMIYRFAGGGTNWIILKAEKGGLGLISGLMGRLRDNKDFENKKYLSEMSGKEIEETLYNIQKSNDKFARGALGLGVNALLLSLAMLALNAGDDEEEEKKRKALTRWMSNNKWSTKYINNLIPFYITAYLAFKRQEAEKKGFRGVADMHRASPLRAYAYNFANMQEQSTIETLGTAAGDLFHKKQKKVDEAYGKIGMEFGKYFNTNPLPFRFWKDAYTLIAGAAGKLDQDYIKPDDFWEGYLKYGISDWPKLEKKSVTVVESY